MVSESKEAVERCAQFVTIREGRERMKCRRQELAESSCGCFVSGMNVRRRANSRGKGRGKRVPIKGKGLVRISSTAAISGSDEARPLRLEIEHRSRSRAVYLRREPTCLIQVTIQ